MEPCSASGETRAAGHFRAVTLGAFTWRNPDRVAMLFAVARNSGAGTLAAHFLLLSACLNFPVVFAIARLSPFRLFGRLYGADFLSAMPEFALLGDPGAFDAFMAENDYGRNVLLPILGMTFLATLAIQAVFCAAAVFLLGISRMNLSPLSPRGRAGLVLYSSTLPVLLSAVLGMFLPAVHIIVCYLAVIMLVFQRSSLCPNG